MPLLSHSYSLIARQKLCQVEVCPCRLFIRYEHSVKGSDPGLFALGVRFATAARGRWLAAVATIAVCAGVVTLMLALASLLERLREDPGTIGKRYQLAVTLDPARWTRRGGCRAWPRSASATASTPPTRSGSASPCGSSPTPATTREFEDAAAGRRAADPRAERGRGRSRARRRARPAARARCSRRRSPTAARSASASRASCARSRTTAGSAGSSRTGCSTPRPDLSPQVVVRARSGADPAAVTRRLVDTRRAAAAASAPRRPTTPRSWPCSPRCCAASASPSASCACTRSCRR